MAFRMAGFCTIQLAPSTPSIVNHSSIMGPKALPTIWVPKLCSKNSPAMMPMTMYTITPCVRPGYTCLRPSMAEATEMGGVITPSASRAEPPMMATAESQAPRRRTSA